MKKDYERTKIVLTADHGKTFFFHQVDITFRFHCVSVQVQVLSGAPWRVFLQHLKRL